MGGDVIANQADRRLWARSDEGIKVMAEVLYAFNITRQSFLNLGVKVADTLLSRLRGLLGKVKLRSDEGIWVIPSRGIHTIGLLFPIDAIYLDSEMRVIRVIEDLRPLRIPPICLDCASVLELPADSIYGSGTQIGDQLMICSPEAFDKYWAQQQPLQSVCSTGADGN